MITVNNLSIAFSGIELFDNVSFVIADKDRIGLVGKNGAGKSTLLKILSKQQEPQSGTIIIPQSQTIGYLPQEMIPSSTMNIMDETLTAFEEAKELEKKIEELSNLISHRTDYESNEYEMLLHLHFEANERLVLIDAANAQAEAEKVLLGLGFSRNDFERKITEFSSGWQMRVELAKILLKKPDIILLDEPTNHLDIESIGWLENFLINYFGAVVLVSHDRVFLDNITRRTIEITAGKIYDYKVSYSDYVDLLFQRRETQRATLTNQQKQIAEIEKFIERFRYKATKAKQVQSRIKQIEKMELETIDEVDTSTIHFRFPPSPHSGKIVVQMKNLGKKYGTKEILKDVNIIIEKGAKIAFVGKNGEGKSTLSKIIVGEITDYSGEYKEGHQVSIGYFAQNQAALLDGNKTVFETIDEVAVGDIRSKIRNILGSFLFGEDDIDKKVKVLSGGEKSRLALAKLILSPVNLLVLDEPTNHLDMDSKDILKNALIRYDGTLIIVSHDRDFLQGLTNSLYEFRNKHITEFKGDIFEYLEHRKIEDLKTLETAKAKDSQNKTAVVSKNKMDYEKSKEWERELRKIRTKIEKTEQEIESLEAEIQEIDSKLADPNIIQTLTLDDNFYKTYQSKKDHLMQKMKLWEDLSLELEEKT
ncbi:MAG: ABC-F family ATP-binding cassette domain-containing protein [Bacteroidales bacterium]|jgi:ATP-binding cassette subfamily F protein 3|nr:ABC-F family ATP-binding cassette domain-containing protein [Bacteroidales bacterium]